MILTTVLLFVSAISVISTLAASVKEATSMVSPMMILVTLVGMSGMLGAGSTPSWAFLIPVYNSVQCISGIFSHSYEPSSVLIAMLINCSIAVVLVFVLTKLFNNEKVMFKK